MRDFSRTANLMNGFQMNGRVVDPQKQSIIVELLLMKKTQARLQQKVVRREERGGVGWGKESMSEKA